MGHVAAPAAAEAAERLPALQVPLLLQTGDK